MDTLLTADVAASAPRFRRRSSVLVDAIHDLPERAELAPAQLYSTESGRLFHSGQIVIVTVGLPARGKTHIAVAIARYLRWLGVKTQVFHLGDYRRATLGPGKEVPKDYFHVNASPSSVLTRNKILLRCREDILHFFEEENGQVAIYDAVNALADGRRGLAKEFARRQIQTIFVESFCDDEKIIQENVRSVKISSPDYQGWSSEDAVKDYLARLSARIPFFETMEEPDLHWIKMINAGKRFVVNDCAFGYLPQRIVFYLLNLHVQSRSIYFARAGIPSEAASYKEDTSLSPEGLEYARKMTDTLLEHRKKSQKRQGEKTGSDETAEETDADADADADLPRPLSVWTSTSKHTMETGQFFEKLGYRTRHRTLMQQMNPGVCEKLSVEEMLAQYPEEARKHSIDPYHHRYPRAESYHDLAVRLEPIILEMEREKNDLLLIANETVLRVLYGYLMARNAADIPSLEFPRNEIIEILPSSYNNQIQRIQIPDLSEGALKPYSADPVLSAPLLGLSGLAITDSSSEAE